MHGSFDIETLKNIDFQGGKSHFFYKIENSPPSPLLME